jgi:hypothetical protein
MTMRTLQHQSLHLNWWRPQGIHVLVYRLINCSSYLYGGRGLLDGCDFTLAILIHNELCPKPPDISNLKAID